MTLQRRPMNNAVLPPPNSQLTEILDRTVTVVEAKHQLDEHLIFTFPQEKNENDRRCTILLYVRNRK